ncbi:MAG: hypothetical protein IJK53_04140 [Erysipelotrichaceae bacterium]|nr:hypothetical protein [Erysipelotrichaceae bacterium]
MAIKLINDQELELVSGGVLKEGWESITLTMISMYKTKFGDSGKQRLKDTLAVGVDDPTSTMEESDLVILYSFIDENW